MDEEISLACHEGRSQARYEGLMGKLDQLKKGADMSVTDIADKVNIHVGGADGGANTAALIAALGQRGGGAGLESVLPAMLANNNGVNNWWPLLLLLGRRGFGLGDGDGCAPAAAASAALDPLIANAVNGLTSAVPTSALETQAVIQNALAHLGQATQQGFSNTKDTVQNATALQLGAINGVKDAVQASFAILNQNILDQGCKGREATQASTTAILQKIDADRIRELELAAMRAERANEINALRSQVEVNQTVTTTQAQTQGQAQLQAQLQDLQARLGALSGLVAIGNQTMLARQAQDIVNLGTMTASGTQAAANTQVR